MATPTADKLRTYFASKYLSSDGDTITQQTADASCTVSTIIDAALTEADDYWNGAIGWFDGATTTSALQGVFFHVTDFTASSDTLTLSRDLPAAPAAGDNYYLVLGGNYRGDIETFGMLADGDLPEEISVTGTNITGLTIKKCSPLLGEGTLSVFYDQSEDELSVKMDAEAYGVVLDVSGDVSDGIVFCADGEKYVQVDVTNGSLPGGDQTDTFATTYPEGTLTPDYTGAETTAGKTRYRLEVCKNTDGADTMTALAVYSSVPSGTATTLAAGESLGTGAGDFEATDASDWPTHAFWIKNTTTTDCRFVLYRSGNQIYCAAAGGGLRGYTAGSWSAADAVEIMPDVDLAVDAPSSDQFENPSTETTAPGALSFGDYTSASTLSIGDLTSGSIYGVWRRETIIAGQRARDDINTDTYYTWS